MRITMLKTSRHVATSARTLNRLVEGYIYDVSEADAKVIVDSGDARYSEDSEECPPKRWQVVAKKKTTKKKKSKKSKNAAKPPVPEPDMDSTSDPEVNTDGEV